MLPVLIEIGGLTLHTFGVMVATGFIMAMWWCRREAERLGYNVTRVMDLVFWLMVWGLIGARALFIVVNWDAYAADPVRILYVWQGGLVWYGGFLAALAAGVVLMRRWRLPVLKTCDLVAPSVMYGLAYGRLGCLSAGDDHGRLIVSALGEKARAMAAAGELFGPGGRLTAAAVRTIHQEGFDAPWWSLTFGPQSLVQGDLVGMPLYPAQPVMSLYCLAIFAGLVVWRRCQRFPGELLALLLIVYPICRYFLEFMRGDLGRGFLLPGVSTSQAISLAVAAAGVALYAALGRSGRRTVDPEKPLTN